MRRSLPVFRAVKPRNLRSPVRTRALRLVDLQSSLVVRRSAHADHDAFARRAGCEHNVAITAYRNGRSDDHAGKLIFRDRQA